MPFRIRVNSTQRIADIVLVMRDKPNSIGGSQFIPFARLSLECLDLGWHLNDQIWVTLSRSVLRSLLESLIMELMVIEEEQRAQSRHLRLIQISIIFIYHQNWVTSTDRGMPNKSKQQQVYKVFVTKLSFNEMCRRNLVKSYHYSFQSSIYKELGLISLLQALSSSQNLFNFYWKTLYYQLSLYPKQFLVIMEKLIFSRRQKQEQLQRVDKLSPEKYGKGAFLDLTFTPSKLTEHVLYRQATNLKKIQEESCKGRELEVANKILQDQVEFLKRERDGIEKSLTKMIEMYKQIIAQMEAKNQERIRIIQVKFCEEIQRYIKDKEEEAKFVQSEKEVFERHIQQLDGQITKLKEEVQYLTRNKGEIQLDLDNLKVQHQNLTKSHEQLQKKSKADMEKARQDYDDLKERALNAEVAWKDKLREEIHKKDIEIEKNERIHKGELEKVESQRNADTQMKNQEVKELTRTFQVEMNRLKDILNNKERTIEIQLQEANKQKVRVANLTREYETEITHLTHQKNRLIEEIDAFSRENQVLAQQKVVMGEQLANENDKLRELLYESSMELQKCRAELVGLAKDNQKLVTRVRSSEQQAKTWRDSYYLNRTRPG